jgi:adenylate kinase family enzyme
MYEKIVIIGSPGAGKTTLAQRLHAILDIEVIHLDLHFWLPGWKEKPIEDRIEIQRRLVLNERWIMEGTYLDSSDVRLNAADTIIFLDMPWFLCLWRVFKRRVEYRNKQRPDLPEGCREKLHLPYILKVLAFPWRGRRLFFAKVKDLRERDASDPKKKKTLIVRLHSIEKADDFLREVSAKLQKWHAC